MARQATPIDAERKKAGATLVVDGGNLAGDPERALVVVKSLKAVGYDAVVPTEGDEQLGAGFLAQANQLGIALVGSMPECKRMLAKEVAGRRVAVGSLLGNNEAALNSLNMGVKQALEERVQLLVVSSDCGAAVDTRVARSLEVKEMDVIIFSRGLAEPSTINRVHLVPTPQGGKAVCRVGVSWERAKVEIRTTYLPVTQELQEDRRVTPIIAKYYAEETSRAIVNGHMRPAEQLTQPYADRDQCVDCHQTTVESVSQHRHSEATETLKSKERLVPECLTCHSELYRRTKRWHPDDPIAWSGVECATCHGDGILHSQIGTKESTTRKVPESLCRSCHTPEQDPKFDYVKRLEGIRHWK
ncbi:MAG: hypothetical protein HY318_09655 [Armatimonadetes bacterium]|nr:hypothetical protein [Armatimonadota bacterium]